MSKLGVLGGVGAAGVGALASQDAEAGFTGRALSGTGLGSEVMRKMAAEMLAKGASPEEVYKLTGWGMDVVGPQFNSTAGVLKTLRRVHPDPAMASQALLDRGALIRHHDWESSAQFDNDFFTRSDRPLFSESELDMLAQISQQGSPNFGPASARVRRFDDVVDAPELVGLYPEMRGVPTTRQAGPGAAVYTGTPYSYTGTPSLLSIGGYHPMLMPQGVSRGDSVRQYMAHEVGAHATSMIDGRAGGLRQLGPSTGHQTPKASTYLTRPGEVSGRTSQDILHDPSLLDRGISAAHDRSARYAAKGVHHQPPKDPARKIIRPSQGVLFGAGAGGASLLLGAEESEAGNPFRKPPLSAENYALRESRELAAQRSLAQGPSPQERGTQLPGAPINPPKSQAGIHGRALAGGAGVGIGAGIGAALGFTGTTYEEEQLRAANEMRKDFLTSLPAATAGFTSDTVEFLANTAVDLTAWAGGGGPNNPYNFPQADSDIDIPFGMRELSEMMGMETYTPGWMAAAMAAPVGPTLAALKGARAVAGGVGALVSKGKAALGSLMDLPPRLHSQATAPKTTTMEARVGTTGDYRGGPEGVDTPQKLGALRTRVEKLTEQGVPGRNWYDDASEEILFAAGDRPGVADRAAGAFGSTSLGAGVDANTGWGIKAFNQSSVGASSNSGRWPSGNAERMARLEGPGPHDMGPKADPFSEALSTAWRPNFAIRPTNDIRQGRVYEFTQANPDAGKPIFDKKGKQTGVEPDRIPWDSGFKEAQHRFLDRENAVLVERANQRGLGGHTDWNAQRVQAAQWVAQRARQLGISIEEAAKHLGDFFPKNTARVSVESMPGPADHIPSLRENPRLSQEYHQLQNDIMLDPQGRPVSGMGLGALVQRGFESTGDYAGRNDPVTNLGILAGREQPKVGPAVMDPSSRVLVEGTAATEGVLRGQKEVGYNLLTAPGAKASERNMFDVELGRGMGVDDVQRVKTALGPLAKRIAIVPTPTGMRAILFEGASVADEKALQAALKSEGFPKATGGYGSSGVVGADTYKPSAYLAKLEHPVLAQRFDTFAPQLAKKLSEMDSTFEPKRLNKVIVLTRKVIADGGIKGLQDAVKKGLIPAAVMGLVLAGMDQPEGSAAESPPTS